MFVIWELDAVGNECDTHRVCGSSGGSEKVRSGMDSFVFQGWESWTLKHLVDTVSCEGRVCLELQSVIQGCGGGK